jgi:hypothetical protein
LFAGHSALFVELGVAELLNVELDKELLCVAIVLIDDEVADVVGILLVPVVVVCDDVPTLLVLPALVVVELADDPDELPVLLLEDEMALADEVEVPVEFELEPLDAMVPTTLILVELLAVDVADVGVVKLVDVDDEVLTVAGEPPELLAELEGRKEVVALVEGEDTAELGASVDGPALERVLDGEEWNGVVVGCKAGVKAVDVLVELGPPINVIGGTFAASTRIAAWN